MKEKIAIGILMISGIVMSFQYYFSQYHFMQYLYRKSLDWTIIISAFAILIAIYSLLKRQFNEIKEHKTNPIYPLTTLISFFTVIILWIFGGDKENSAVQFIYLHFQVPLQAAIFSLLAFYITSAAYRAFRAKTFTATILLVTASIMIIGRTPLGDYLSHITTLNIANKKIIILNFPAWVQWILTVPNVGVKRAFKFGITIGIILTSLKVIFGIERNWLK